MSGMLDMLPLAKIFGWKTGIESKRPYRPSAGNGRPVLMRQAKEGEIWIQVLYILMKRQNWSTAGSTVVESYTDRKTALQKRDELILNVMGGAGV